MLIPRINRLAPPGAATSQLNRVINDEGAATLPLNNILVKFTKRRNVTARTQRNHESAHRRRSNFLLPHEASTDDDTPNAMAWMLIAQAPSMHRQYRVPLAPIQVAGSCSRCCVGSQSAALLTDARLFAAPLQCFPLTILVTLVKSI